MTEMRDVDHTHPKTAETFGEAFRRGPDVAADGGERDPTRDAEQEQEDEQTMAETATTPTMDEVDHTSTDEGVDRSFERGTEGRSDTV